MVLLVAGALVLGAVWLVLFLHAPSIELPLRP